MCSGSTARGNRTTLGRGKRGTTPRSEGSSCHFPSCVASNGWCDWLMRKYCRRCGDARRGKSRFRVIKTGGLLYFLKRRGGTRHELSDVDVTPQELPCEAMKRGVISGQRKFPCN